MPGVELQWRPAALSAQISGTLAMSLNMQTGRSAPLPGQRPGGGTAGAKSRTRTIPIAGGGQYCLSRIGFDIFV